MKLTKKLEAEILKAYNTLWDANLKGDIKTFASYLDNNVTVYGTAPSEIFTSKKEAVKFYAATADQMTGKAEFRKRKINIKAVGDTVLINEQCDLYVLAGKTWMFYDHARITGIFEFKENAWKAVHMHGSFPDNRTEQGDQIATEKIKQENIQLRDAVKRRTIELEDKNRVLEIETALEKVRAIAMGMKEPADMLKICKTISEQLTKLGVKEIRNVQTAIFYESRGTYMNYEYYSKHDKTFITETSYTNNKIHRAFAAKMLKGKGEFFATHIKDKKVKEWVAYQKTTNVFIDKYLNTATSLNYYWHSLGPVALGISTYSPLSKEELDLFQRFLKVFGLAYRRYLDIEKANAQAREAQIEVAVERVRAKAMAMQRSEQIHEVVRTLHNELLGINVKGITGVTICLKQDDGQVRLWDITDLETTGRYGWDVLFDMDKIDSRLWVKKIWNAKKNIIEIEQDASDLKRALKWLSQYDKKTADNITEFLKVNKITHGWNRAVKLFKGILITDFINEPPAEINPILLKMGAAFDLAYKRFLDLKNAEAQAREVEIELGLERVRARAMAMQNSNELAELVAVVFKELTHLGFSLTSCIIWISDKETLANTLWVTSAAMNTPAEPVRLKPFQHSFFHSIIHAWKEKDPKWIYTLAGKEKASFEKAFFADEPNMPVALKKALSVPKQVVFSASFNNFGALEILGTERLTDEKFEILHRFGKVFDSSYTRFNDLKKAEAQTREAQIEVAVERVRAKALAMHRSDEIGSVANVLRNELESLNIPGVVAATIILQQENGKIRLCDITSVIELKDGFHFAMDFQFDLKGTKPNDWIRRIWDSKEKYFVYKQDKKDFKRTLEWTAKYDPDFVENAEVFLKTNNIRSTWHPVVPLSHGKLSLDLFQEPVAEVESILTKMAAAFDLAYKRFLDLQKAEAQTRDAQIEVAVERVRAKALAMHKSEEIIGVIDTLWKQMVSLKIESVVASTIYLKQNDGKIRLWDLTSVTDLKDGYRLEIDVLFKPEDIDPELWINRLWKSNAAYIVLEESDFKKIFKWAQKFVSEKVAREGRQFVKSNKIKKVWIAGVSLENGKLSCDLLQPPPAEMESILLKMGAAFDLAYKRFLDLEKAEAQAREAQIQLALERVRARTMAMHHSDELTEVVKLLYQEFDKLKLSNESTDIEIGLIDEETGMAKVWAHLYLSDGSISTFNFPFAHFDPINDEYKRWKSTPVEKRNELFITTEFSGNLWEKFKTLAAEVPELAEMFDALIAANIEKWVTHNAYFSHGLLTLQGTEAYSPETLEIQKRFAKVFEQTYTRFLDLQKAEAQAREAQIEAALERVRSRTMAMQRSDELPQAASLLFQQIQTLGMPAFAAGYCIWDDDKQAITLWMSSEGLLQPPFKAPTTEDKLFIEMRKGYEEGKSLHVVEMGGKELVFHYQYMRTLPVVGEIFDSILKSGHSLPTFQVMHQAYFSKGFLLFITYEAVPEAHDIFKRFASVFDQTYTRFLDLQKAEAQSREAQIELGLERVRARAMAMQNSDQLKELIGTVFTELTRLDLVLTRCVIMIYDGEANSSKWWMANSEDPDNPVGFYIKPHDYAPMNAYFKAWHERKLKYTYELEGQVKKDWDDFLFTETELKNMPELVIEGMKAPDLVYLNASFNNFGNLTLASLEPLSEEHFDILLRFAKVFDLTYTRFNDLQKAEAQAREAKIEAALERVRSRSMAMHKTDELLDTAEIVHKELSALGVNSMNVSYAFVSDDEKYGSYYSINPVDGRILPIPFVFPHTETKEMLSILTSWKKQESINVIELNEKTTLEHQTYIGQHIQQQLAKNNIPFSVEDFLKVSPRQAVLSTFNFAKGYLFNIGNERLTETEVDILLRFTRVFEQTYTRFLDLQKAEAQAREAQIQLALERVRARTMAMHKSDELAETAQVLFQQVAELGGVPDRISIGIVNEKENVVDFWTTDQTGTQISQSFRGRLNEPTTIAKVYADWKADKKTTIIDISGEELKQWIQFAREEMGIVVKDNFFKDRRVHTCTFFLHGWIMVSTHQPLSNETIDILERFASVFNLTYRRFLDLQKAEAQARESQIELGLERVRARAMAMQKSDELKELIGTVSSELGKLDIILDRCFIITYDTQTMGSTWWMSNPETPTEQIGLFIKYHEHPSYLAHINAWNDRKVKWEYILEGELKKSWDRFLFVETQLSQLPSFVIENMRSKEKVYLSSSFNNFGYLSLATLEPLSNEQFDILLRFAKVFDLTYTRFNDLQKAEAQAREAKIEAALEKVRSRTMAMQSSNELQETAAVLFKEFKKLGADSIYQVTIGIYKEEEQVIDFRVTSWAGGGEQENRSFQLDMSEPIVLHPSVQAWKSGKKSMVFDLTGEKLEGWIRFRNKMSGVNVSSQDTDGRRVISVAYFSKGHISISTPLPVPEETIKTLERFATVFDGTYTRFLDLQNAEAQAREAKIEASLERVRSKAMAMHSSQDLTDTIGVFYNELHSFSITPRRCGVGLLNKEERVGELFTWNTTEDGHSLELVGKLKMVGHPVLNGVYEHWLSQTEYHPVLRGNEIKEYYKIIRPQINFPDYNNDEVQYGYFFFFKEGGVYAWTQTEMKEDELNIYRRFTSVLSLTYKRFKDLQQAEAQTREAQIEAALEKVRSRTLAMQKSDELAETAAEVFRQLIGLGMEPNRLYIGIVHGDTKDMEMWATDEDGSGVGKKFTFNASDNASVKKLFDGWTAKIKSVTVDMQGAELEDYINYLKKLHIPLTHALTQKRRVQSVAYFDKGFIGMASPDEQSEKNIHLLERFAAVFNLTFTRFNDLKLAEAHALQAEQDLIAIKEAKQKAEEALTELQSTQKQLVQSEKMASLGELTAGIAHEIQNPLNFVNNFSDVSNELIDEMMEEVAKGNYEIAKEIAEDVKQNLQKINHHGKRADGIVKGMLQHSRTSSSQKESTDINALADEYLRLAYHGLRAKDKSFNAKFETEFDSSIGKIEIMPQDIGRVILNLINNAFYAVSEKKKQNTNGYEPTVTITTKKTEDKIEVKVKDNGTGIPQKVVEKIFQPFFTTKPTGQGTGLGLSLAYDIVKAHGGELKVETKEGEGTEFIIQLPIN